MKLSIKAVLDRAFSRHDDLICEGGASGHMSHLFEDPDLTFKDLKNIFTKLFKGKISVSEKCLSPDAKVQLKTYGEKTIQEVVDNKLEDDILSYNESSNQLEYSPIVGWADNGSTDNWLKITFEDGTELICTPNHRIWNNTVKTDVKAEDLAVGDEVLTI